MSPYDVYWLTNENLEQWGEKFLVFVLCPICTLEDFS